jgi:hypothetical protein
VFLHSGAFFIIGLSRLFLYIHVNQKYKIMSTKQLVKEQMQEDLLSLLESMGLDEVLDPRDWEALKNEVCDIVVTGINNIEE